MKESIKAALTVALGFLAAALFVASGHCAVSRKHNNSLGTVMYTDNPFTYKAGSIVALAEIDGGLVVRIQPIGTYSLYTEDLLFCGMNPEKFLNHTNPMVLTYRTQASRIVEGIGCHALVNVSSLQTEKIQ